MSGLKTCPVCKTDKPLTEYYVRRGRLKRDGTPSYQHGCKVCRRDLTLQWQAAHPTRTREIGKSASRRYYGRNAESVKAAQRARWQADPEAARKRWREQAAKRKAQRETTLP